MGKEAEEAVEEGKEEGAEQQQQPQQPPARAAAGQDPLPPIVIEQEARHAGASLPSGPVWIAPRFGSASAAAVASATSSRLWPAAQIPFATAQARDATQQQQGAPAAAG